MLDYIKNIENVKNLDRYQLFQDFINQLDFSEFKNSNYSIPLKHVFENSLFMDSLHGYLSKTINTRVDLLKLNSNNNKNTSLFLLDQDSMISINLNFGSSNKLSKIIMEYHNNRLSNTNSTIERHNRTKDRVELSLGTKYFNNIKLEKKVGIFHQRAYHELNKESYLYHILNSGYLFSNSFYENISHKIDKGLVVEKEDLELLRLNEDSFFDKQYNDLLNFFSPDSYKYNDKILSLVKEINTTMKNENKVFKLI